MPAVTKPAVTTLTEACQQHTATLTELVHHHHGHHVTPTGFPLTHTHTIPELAAAATHMIRHGLTNQLCDRDTRQPINLNPRIHRLELHIGDTTHHILGDDPAPIDLNDSIPSQSGQEHNTISQTWTASRYAFTADHQPPEPIYDRNGDRHCFTEANLWTLNVTDHDAPNGPAAHLIDQEFQWVIAAPAGHHHNPNLVAAISTLELVIHETLESCWTGNRHPSTWNDDTWILEHLIDPHLADHHDTSISDDTPIAWHVRLDDGNTYQLNACFN